MYTYIHIYMFIDLKYCDIYTCFKIGYCVVFTKQRRSLVSLKYTSVTILQ